MRHERVALSISIPLLLALPLTACDLSGETEKPGPTATHINQVRTMQLQTNDCPAGIAKALREHGFAVLEENQQADARLDVTVTRTGRNLDQVPEFGGFGAKATFSAKVIGADDAVLFTTSGKEGSLTSEEMCEDLGDELAEKLRGSPLGTVN